MTWDGMIVLLLLAVPFMEMSGLKAAGKKRDIAVFAAIWCLAFAAILAEWLGLPMPRPLDWIRMAAQPINRLLP